MKTERAFTLLEVMIAMGIFFMAIFAILDLVAVNLRATRALRPHNVDASSLAAELMLTNRIEEGTWSGDFGDLHPGYSWTKNITLVSTNGLFQVDFAVSRDDGGEGNQTHMSVLVYRPESQVRPGASSRGGLR
jgi:Tfp pilus assembly protein PilV